MTIKIESIFGPPPYKCSYCGQLLTLVPSSFMGGGSGLNIDHVFPRSLGGDSDIDNLVLSCGNCNRAKSNQGVISYLRWLAFIRSSRFECSIIKKIKSELTNLETNDLDKLQKDYWE